MIVKKTKFAIVPTRMNNGKWICWKYYTKIYKADLNQILDFEDWYNYEIISD